MSDHSPPDGSFNQAGDQFDGRRGHMAFEPGEGVVDGTAPPVAATTLADWTSPTSPAYPVRPAYPSYEWPAPVAAPAHPAARRIVAMAVVMVLVLAGAVTAVLVAGKTSADAAVASAVSSALNDRTAVLTLSGSASVAGTTVAISGAGHSDFTQGAMALQMKLNGAGAGQDLTENTVYLGGVMYLNMGDLIGQVLPGKSWLSLDLSQLSTDQGSTSPLGLGGSTTTNNPVALLKLLGQGGNNATDLGPSIINGQTVEGYAVSVSQGALRAQLARPNLPSWMRQAMASVRNPHASYRVYVNKAGLLARQTTDLSLTVSGHTLTEGLSMDYSGYGTPVTITAPPAGEVSSFGDFLTAAQALSSSTTT